MDKKIHPISFKVILFFLFLINPPEIYSQIISGTITDENKTPLEFASVVLYSLPDSAVLGGSITDKEGRFSIESGGTENTILKVSLVGYKTVAIIPDDSQMIILPEHTYELEEVVISASMRPYRMGERGAVVANVAGSILSQEMNMVNLLSKMPGIIEKNNNIELFSGGSVLIYINGRRAHSFEEVRMLEVKNIKDITLDFNPSAEYDASTSAVMLIKTLKRDDGFAIQLSQGIKMNHHWNNETGINLNYQRDRLNLYMMLSYNLSQFKSYEKTDITVNNPDTLWNESMELSIDKARVDIGFISAGADYSLTEKQNIGVRYNGMIYGNNDLLDQVGAVYANGDHYKNITGDIRRDDRYGQNQFSAYYTNIENSKIEFRFYTDYITTRTKTMRTSNEGETSGDQVTIQNDNDGSLDLFAVNPRFKYVINDNNNISFGGEYSIFSNTINSSLTENRFQKSDNENKENKAATYVDYSFYKNDFSISAGLRFENVRFRFSDHLNSSENISKDYNNLFPNISISYNKNGFSNSLNYRTSVTRPDIAALGGTSVYFNRFMIIRGNPALVPSVAHAVNYSFMYKILYLSAGYIYHKNPIISAISSDPNDPKVIIMTSSNHNNSHRFYAMANLQPDFGIYRPVLSAQYTKNYIKLMDIDGQRIKIEPAINLDFNNSFALPSNMLFSVRYNYFSGGMASDGVTDKPKNIFDVSLQKNFVKNNLQVELSANDIFNKNIDRQEFRAGRFHYTSYSDFDRRSVTLRIAWFFNTLKKEFMPDMNSAAEGELGRLNR